MPRWSSALHALQAILLGILWRALPGHPPLLGATLGLLVALFTLAAVLVLVRHAFARAVSTVAAGVSIGVGSLLIALTLSGASYLYGIYGATGRALSLLGLTAALVVTTLFGFIPSHALALARRAGRRA